MPIESSDNVVYKKYLHDIRNMKIFDSEMINNIRTMTDKEKMEIIIAMNDVIEGLVILVEAL